MKGECFARGWPANQWQNQIRSLTNFLRHVLWQGCRLGDPDETVQEGSLELLTLILQDPQIGTSSKMFCWSTEGQHRSPNWSCAIPQAG